MVTLASFQDIKVPTPGFGVMSMSGAYGSADGAEATKVLKEALDSGCTFWDTAVAYGHGGNEELIGRFLAENDGAREKLFIASKCGFEIDFEKKSVIRVSNKADHIRSYLCESTRRLGSAPDLYYLHRRDPDTSLEESIGTLDQLRKEGKVRYIGLSEVSAETLRAACKVAHVDALQIEYSAFCLDNEENGLLAAAKELGVTVVAFSPLGAGFLTGKYNNPEAFNGDMRTQAGRFSPENIKSNLRLVEEFEKIAKTKGCTTGQLALAWVAAQGAIPIPGTKQLARLKENFGATQVELSQEELKDIRRIISENPTKGSRWGDAIMSAMGK